MMNGDLLTKLDFEQLLNFHDKQCVDATICVREYDFQVPYGVIKMKDKRVTSIIEKPIHKFFINAGVYVLNPSVFKMIDGKSYIDMHTMLKSRIDNGSQVGMFPIHEYWLDIGRIDSLNKAKVEWE